MFWLKLLSFIGIIFLIIWLISYIRANPDAFNKENMRQSFYVLGILALVLIGVIAVLVLILQSL